ncbi:hypothetical protein [Streptomyces sp. NPDC014006]|uniref:hypothetical protein n=1 Tax=Streptomyces sp. NPDC014006 TaxID=3364870 RepID=UPI00370146E8
MVGVVEALASSLFRTAVANADSLLNGKGAIFQRLDHMADLIVTAGFSDLRTTLGRQTWQRLLETWAARHVFTHNDGLVDERYLTKVPGSSPQVGQRLVLTEAMCRRALEDAKALCEALVAVLRWRAARAHSRAPSALNGCAPASYAQAIPSPHSS